MLDGGIEGRPENVVFYATSNRRHLMPRDMIENERSTAINSLARRSRKRCRCRTGSALWLGFHPCDQDEYLAMIRGYCDAYGVDIDGDTLRAEAIEWQATRVARVLAASHGSTSPIWLDGVAFRSNRFTISLRTCA